MGNEKVVSMVFVHTDQHYQFWCSKKYSSYQRKLETLAHVKKTNTHIHTHWHAFSFLISTPTSLLTTSTTTTITSFLLLNFISPFHFGLTRQFFFFPYPRLACYLFHSASLFLFLTSVFPQIHVFSSSLPILQTHPKRRRCWGRRSTLKTSGRGTTCTSSVASRPTPGRTRSSGNTTWVHVRAVCCNPQYIYIFLFTQLSIKDPLIL